MFVFGLGQSFCPGAGRSMPDVERYHGWLSSLHTAAWYSPFSYYDLTRGAVYWRLALVPWTTTGASLQPTSPRHVTI